MEDDDELPIPALRGHTRKFVGVTQEDARIWQTINKSDTGAAKTITYWGAGQRDAEIMLALTQLQGIRPARKRLALFLKYAS